jgi:transcriptional regulator with XRE-family HTH domain
MARNTNGAALRSIRELAGVKQKTLAAHLGIKPSTMSQVESGRHNLHPEKLRKAADYLGVPLGAISTTIPEPAAS